VVTVRGHVVKTRVLSMRRADRQYCSTAAELDMRARDLRPELVGAASHRLAAKTSSTTMLDVASWASPIPRLESERERYVWNRRNKRANRLPCVMITTRSGRRRPLYPGDERAERPHSPLGRGPNGPWMLRIAQSSGVHTFAVVELHALAHAR